jgi:DNA (cytosine-5)-methyltransferase 1
LDLYCGAGGCSAGYVKAGFDVVGVDVVPQPRYLDSGAVEFVQADALAFLAEHWQEYDLVHCSPPCQAHSRCKYTPGSKGKDYPNLLTPTLQLLAELPIVWVVENVLLAPMPADSLMLCGSMFGLKVRRHRLFASNIPLTAPGPCRHGDGDLGVYAGKVTRLGSRATAYLAGSGRTHYRPELATLEEGRAAMGIDWMNRYELSEAIPPAYTEFLGRQLLTALAQHAQ